MSRRRIATGIAVALAYVALASLSAWLSPIARRPALDGLGPVPPYRWVSPPPDLADGNQPPAAGSFEVPLTQNGSDPGVFITPDNQVTVVVDRDAFPARGDEEAVALTVTPLDPATLGALPEGLTAFGNALDLRATYEPSGGPVRRIAPQLRVVAVYPITQRLHAATHSILRSEDGETWTPLPSRDAPGIQQVEASVAGSGFLVVAGALTPNVLTPTPSDDGLSAFAVVLLVTSAATLLVGVALLVRGRTVR